MIRCPRCQRGQMFAERATGREGNVEFRSCICCGHVDYGEGWKPPPRIGDGRLKREPKHGKVRL